MNLQPCSLYGNVFAGVVHPTRNVTYILTGETPEELSQCHCSHWKCCLKRDHKKGLNIWEELMYNHFRNKLTHARNKIQSKIEADQHYAKSNHCSEMRINNSVLGTGWPQGITVLVNCSSSQRHFNIMNSQI